MKSVIAHGVLALFGLIWAYQTYNRPAEEEQETKPEQAVVMQCEEPQLQLVELETQSHTVKIRPKRTPQGPEYWMTSQHKKIEPPKKDDASAGAGGTAAATGGAGGAAAGTGGAAAAKAEPAKDETATPEALKPDEEKEPRPYDPDAPVEFVANPKFDEVVKWAAPLTAVRALGKLDAKQLTEFGFDKVVTFLRLECGGKKLQLDIGGRTFGSGDSYARDAKTGDVYLLDGKKIVDLQSAQFRFMQTELHNFTLADVDTAVVTAAGKTRTLSQRNRQSKDEARWVDAAAPDKRNELFGNWFERVERMRAKLYLKDGQQPGQDLQVKGSAPIPVVTIEYKLEGKTKGKLEVVRVDTTTKQGNLYYARTEATHRWVAMYDSIAKQVEDDVALVVGAEEAPAQSVDPGEQSGAMPGPSADPHPATPPAAPVNPHAAAPVNAHAASPHGPVPAAPSH